MKENNKDSKRWKDKTKDYNENNKEGRKGTIIKAKEKRGTKQERRK